MSINAHAFCDDFCIPVGPRRVVGVTCPNSPLRISKENLKYIGNLKRNRFKLNWRTLQKHISFQQGLNITINADRTLYNFCKWQRKLNPDEDSHPNHHDVAILITREDICSRANTPCSTLGVAHVAGMCQPERSCSVNEDNGITLAHTIAHELGHK